MACRTSTTLAFAFAQFHSSSLSHPQLFFPKLRSSNSSNSTPLSLTSRRTSNSNRVYAKAVSADRQNAIPLADDTQTTPSSSKLVLVVGASGGVGKHSFIHPLSLSLRIYNYKF